jgi:5-methylcytosine-specific restriction endonuclease McrA
MICHEPIDPTLRWPDPGYRTIDHIVPVVMGGEHSYTNTRIAHSRCNSVRGAARGEDLADLVDQIDTA